MPALRSLIPLKPALPLQNLGGRDTRRWPWLLLAAALAALGAWLLWSHLNGPRSLDDVILVGDRNPACHRIVIASDHSGSMSEYIGARQHALEQFAAWAPANLRGDDELAVIAFSGHADLTTPVTAINDNPHPSTAGHTSDSGTELTPILDTTSMLPDHGCIMSLVLLSDGLFPTMPDTPDAARVEMRAAGIDNVFLLLPAPDIDAPGRWNELYPYATATAFDGSDPDATGLAFGRIVSTLTGQQLEKRDR